MQAEGDVPGDRHMRKERVALEHHPHVPAIRRHVRDVPAVEPDRARRRRDESRHHAQRRCLAAAGWAEKATISPAAPPEIEIVDAPPWSHRSYCSSIELEVAHGSRVPD